ncbi:MFS transporter [Vibrio marisflavi]|uniref:Alpha-ketoglutarate permease n=1 Tax=Vibrio marisflavi CECT 7928 TaxID=634439 RepID=A0ABN8EAI9_9VIBR|nr:MFS transporter [Vibrio marisflavi]CAH0543110.1 Alpha-ketoglutarate permease [Vibrio marisflavi CECT 7928]
MLAWKQKLGVISGNALEYYDIAVFAAIMPYLSHIMQESGLHHSNYIVWGIFALRFLIRPFGAVVVGKIADSKGKKNALVLTSTLTGVASLIMACLPVTKLGESVALIVLLLQMAQSFSFAGEFPTITHYLHNNTQKKEAGIISCLIVASSLIGVILSFVVVLALKSSLTDVQMQTYGWRIPLFIGVVNIAISFWFRLQLVEEVPSKTDKPTKNYDFSAVLRMFLVTASGSVAFFIPSFSSGIIAESLHLKNFSIINTVMLFVFMIIAGLATDKLTTPRKGFKVGLILALVCQYPLYYAIVKTDSAAIQWFALASITFISAIILSNLAGALFSVSDGSTVNLGLGYNISSATFGGLSPIIVQYLSSYGTQYVGLYAALASLPALAGLYLYSVRHKSATLVPASS